MISKDKHQKHVPLNKPDLGEFGRNELAILGSSCGKIQELSKELIQILETSYKLSYIDADHASPQISEEENEKTAFTGSKRVTDKQEFIRIDFYHELSVFEKRAILNSEDLIIVNGNHFKAKKQILIIDPMKNIEPKLDRLTDLQAILLKEKSGTIPDILTKQVPNWEQIPVFNLEEKEVFFQWIRDWMDRQVCPLKGLILSGGKSTRMKRDKGELSYHGKSQREHLLSLAQPYCSESYLSCNAEQAVKLKDNFQVIEDVFLNLGPMGGILSAFRFNPNAAWLTLACDLPYLSDRTLQFLITHRNPQKVATAFLDPKGEFPEPLITIWEPKSYPIILNFFSQGISCPRKVLINSEIEVLESPFPNELYNVNYPEEYETVLDDLKGQER